MKKGDIQGFVILGGLALFFVALFLLAPKASQQPLTYVPVDREGTTLVVDDASADLAHVDATVTVTKPSFVTIHTDMGGAPGAPLGSSALIQPGENQVVSAAATLEPEVRYYVLIMEDDGDGVYEAGIDVPVRSGGQTVKGEFVTPAM